MDSSPAVEPRPIAAALAGVCPRCGCEGLFAGALKFAPKCRACGLDFASFNVGDGAAAFLILIVGAILTVAALVVDAAFSPPWFVHLVWILVGAVLTIFGLRAGKAFLLGQEYRHRAGEGKIAS
jgi:uncharacterized protein (DUF983 family)